MSCSVADSDFLFLVPNRTPVHTTRIGQIASSVAEGAKNFQFEGICYFFSSIVFVTRRNHSLVLIFVSHLLLTCLSLLFSF